LFLVPPPNLRLGHSLVAAPPFFVQKSPLYFFPPGARPRRRPLVGFSKTIERHLFFSVPLVLPLIAVFPFAWGWFFVSESSSLLFTSAHGFPVSVSLSGQSFPFFLAHYPPFPFRRPPGGAPHFPRPTFPPSMDCSSRHALPPLCARKGLAEVSFHCTPGLFFPSPPLLHELEVERQTDGPPPPFFFKAIFHFPPP